MAEENVKQQDSTEQTNAPNPNLRTYHGITYDITDPKFQGLSRNAIKKLLKEELWNATREQRNKYQKEKHKRKRAERRQLIEQGVIPPPPPKRPRSEDVVPSPVRVVIDCSFSSYMTEKVGNLKTNASVNLYLNGTFLLSRKFTVSKRSLSVAIAQTGLHCIQ